MSARKRLRPAAKTLPQAMRDFLTPEVFKQVRKAASRRKRPRWDVHPLLYILLLMTWCAGDSLPEKFEVARGFYIVCCVKRKRPGRTFAGFEKAMSKLPMPVLRALADALRGRISAIFGERLLYRGFIPLGCDGTRQACPRTEELEQRLGTFGKKDSCDAAPMIWNTSIVHLTLGIPWCWRFGRGSKASERMHLIQMLPLLPKLALIVTDAGYVGYNVVRALAEANVCFLLRMSSNATFYTEDQQPLSDWREGLVYYWPQKFRDAGQPPIRGRLIRITSPSRKVDVWLLTNVEDQQRLSTEFAGQLYRWRWESEGFFRTYKRTLQKIKLESRTLRLIHREAEASMIATQLLLCQGALAIRSNTRQPTSAETIPVMCSPRGVLLEIRRELRAAVPRRDFTRRLTQAVRERRWRTTSKEKRKWPRRKPHEPPKPPKILMLTDQLKSQIKQHLNAA
jgi:hypothetical protein